MKFFRFPVVAVAGTWLLASCGAGGDAEVSGEAAPQQGFEVKSGDLFNDDTGRIIDRYGATNPYFDKSGQRKGAHEGTQVNQQFTGDFAKQRYKGSLSDYEKRSFWGSKEYAKRVYGGKTDGGRFLRDAREGAMGAREGGRMHGEAGRGFESDRISKGLAREGRGEALGKPSDAETDVRRRIFQEPEVKNWRRRGLDVEDTRAMLGR